MAAAALADGGGRHAALLRLQAQSEHPVKVLRGMRTLCSSAPQQKQAAWGAAGIPRSNGRTRVPCSWQERASGQGYREAATGSLQVCNY